MKYKGLTIILRHFPTEDEILDKVSFETKTPSILKETKKEIPLLAKQLSFLIKNTQIKKIYASDSLQALETAKLFSDKLQLNVIKSKLLRNIKRPLWEGLTNSEIRFKFKKEFDVWTNRPGDVRFKNGERIFDVRKRVAKFNRLYTEPKIVITHTTTFHAFIIENFKLKDNQAWDFKPEMYAFTVLYNGTLWGLNTRSLDYLTLHYR